MNNDIKYVIRGTLLALAVATTILTVQYYVLLSYISTKQPVFVNEVKTTKKDSAPIIVNIEGHNLFNEHCTSCHQLLLYKRVDGPLIEGVENRVKDRNLLHEWIRNSSKVLRSGNPYFNNLIKEYGVMMPDFPQLSDEQIDAILNYIKEVEAQE
jgi:mono/diheme cytochrome c family protein